MNKPSYPICSLCLCLQADNQKHWLWKLLVAASLKTCYASIDWNLGFSVVKDGSPLLPFPHSSANPPAEGHPQSFWAGRYMGHRGNNQDVIGVGFLASRSCAGHSFFGDGGAWCSDPGTRTEAPQILWRKWKLLPDALSHEACWLPRFPKVWGTGKQREEGLLPQKLQTCCSRRLGGERSYLCAWFPDRELLSCHLLPIGAEAAGPHHSKFPWAQWAWSCQRKIIMHPKGPAPSMRKKQHCKLGDSRKPRCWRASWTKP